MVNSQPRWTHHNPAHGASRHTPRSQLRSVGADFCRIPQIWGLLGGCDIQGWAADLPDLWAENRVLGSASSTYWEPGASLPQEGCPSPPSPPEPPWGYTEPTPTPFRALPTHPCHRSCGYPRVTTAQPFPTRLSTRPRSHPPRCPPRVPTHLQPVPEPRSRPVPVPVPPRCRQRGAGGAAAHSPGRRKGPAALRETAARSRVPGPAAFPESPGRLSGGC